MSLSKGLIIAGGLLAASQLAFHPTVRKEIFKRDHGICQCDECIGEFIVGEPFKWDLGFNVNAAHYPDLHGKDNDINMANGRILSVVCHLKEEIDRGNHKGVQLLYERQTIMNTAYLKTHSWHDIKPPLQYFYDWSETGDYGNIVDYFTSSMI